jgi:hypothetical protein
MMKVGKRGTRLPRVVFRKKRINLEKIRIIPVMDGSFYERVFLPDLEEKFRVQP